MSQIFAYQSHQVRTITENHETWFVARDVCNALGLKWHGKVLENIPTAWQGMRSHLTPSGKQRVRVVSEPAVYKLAFRSNKPEADAFTNWVASEVLPAIRKGGEYRAAPRQRELPTGEAPYPEMSADRREALHRIETLRREATTGFGIVRNVVRMHLHPGARSLRPGVTESEAYHILENFYITADQCLAGAYNAIEAGYRFGRLFGKD